MRFEDLHLIEPLLKAVHAEGYTEPTPIQAQAIPHVLEGRDLLGLAQTGTGKTAAFALPILQRLNAVKHAGKPAIRVLILTPTRELASQIGESFATYGKNLGLRHTVIFGGVGQHSQEQALHRGIDVLVATPGRLLDLMQQRFVHLEKLEVFVLDEADRMLDMGFIHDVKRIIQAIPKKRQTLFFSATMPREAQVLADAILVNPKTVAVVPPATTAEKVEQSLFFIEKAAKPALLAHLLKDAAITRALVFSRTKHGANKIAEKLARVGVNAEAIHGNKSQSARERALAGFKAGSVRVLVATDIAARGIDVDLITHVFNFDLPNIPETYVHRIGRTARAGASGIAISFCDRDEREFLRDIERLTRQKIAVVEEHPYANGRRPEGEVLDTADRRPSRPPQRGNHRGGAAPRRSSGGGGGGGYRDTRPPRAGELHPTSSDRAPFRYDRPAGSSAQPPSSSAPRRSGGGGGGGRRGR